MSLVEFYTEDPGDDVLTAYTKLNIVEKLLAGRRAQAAPGRVLMVGAVVNDRGVPEVPVRTTLGEMASVWGGFSPYLGDGAAASYEGNMFARAYRLSAPWLAIQPVDLAIKDATIATGTDLLVSFTRSDAANGKTSIPAGFRIDDGSGYILATLETISWTEAETGSKTVRCRQVAGTPAALNTVTTLTDTPDDANVTVNTADTTVPDDVDAAELLLRYQSAIDQILSSSVGVMADIVLTDRDESGIEDYISAHAETASLQGYFRIAVVGPPTGTTAANAQGSSGDGVGRTTLKDTYAVYAHPHVTRSFALDSANLNQANGWLASFPAKFPLAFAIAHALPEENPCNPHRVLEDYGITGTESLATAPDRETHEQAGIVQPVLSQSANGLVADFHAGVMASGTKIADRRMAFYIYGQWLVLALPYHKKLATQTNQDGLIGSFTSFLERLKQGERIAKYVNPSGVYDANTEQFTVSAAADKTGNMDVITLRVVYGANATDQA